MVKSQVEVLAAVRDFVETLDRVIRVEKVILYGSYARGEAHEWSDIDLLVISRDFEGMSVVYRQELLGVAIARGHCDFSIEAIGKTPEEYEQAGRLSFLHEIRRTGRVVYEAEAA